MTNESKRAVVDYVGPQIDCGRFPIKRAAGETVRVIAHAFADGHDHVRAEALYKKEDQDEWSAQEMNYEANDEWSSTFVVPELGSYLYTVRAWVDYFGTWQSDLRKKIDAGDGVTIALKMGAEMVLAAAGRAEPADARQLEEWARILQSTDRFAQAEQTAPGEPLTQ